MLERKKSSVFKRKGVIENDDIENQASQAEEDSDIDGIWKFY